MRDFLEFVFCGAMAVLMLVAVGVFYAALWAIPVAAVITLAVWTLRLLGVHL